MSKTVQRRLRSLFSTGDHKYASVLFCAKPSEDRSRTGKCDLLAGMEGGSFTVPDSSIRLLPRPVKSEPKLACDWMLGGPLCDL